MARPKKRKTFSGVQARGNTFSYRLRIPDPENPEKVKQIRYSGFTTAEEADRDRSEKRLDLHKGTFHLPTNATIAEFFPECIDTHFLMNGKKQQSKDDYLSHLNSYILPRIGSMALKECKSLNMEKFLIELQKTGSRKGLPLSASTIEKVGIVLKIGFKQAFKHNLISSNPMDNVRIPKGQEKRVEHILDEDLVKIRQKWQELPLAPLFELALNTGARRGEILALRWSDFDTKTNTISISKTSYLSNGVLYENSPKSERSVREIEITQSQSQSLRTHSVRQAEQRLQSGSYWKNNDFIFTNEIGEPLKSAYLYHVWRKVLTASKAGHHHFHAIRHTHITSLLQAGVPAYVVARRAGDTVGTILNTYAHAVKQDDSHCAEVFEGKMVAL